MKAVIIAGGEGKRLRPLTFTIPKPMLPIGKKPILDIIIGDLKKQGFKEVIITLGYKGELIESYFGSGRNFGIKIDYTWEKSQLGTAGPLKLMEEKLDETFLIINGDLLTRVDFKKFMSVHKKKGALLTIGVKDYGIRVPYGVITTSSKEKVKTIEEKPIVRFPIVSGIYAADPKILGFITKNKKMDMPDLIKKLISKKMDVHTYPIKEDWFDIGKLEDYERANEIAKKWGWVK